MATSVFIFVPAFGNQISATTFLTTHAVQQAFAAKGIGGGVSTLSYPDIAELREMAITIFYDAMPNVSHLLFIDADMGFAADVVLDMLLFDEPLVGAIYRQRKEPVSWAGSGTGSPVTARRGGFMHVEGFGMGCTLIRRDCIARMIEQYPELIDTRLSAHPSGDILRSAGAHRLLRFFEKLDLPERGLVSEDISFCIRAAKCGIQSWGSIAHKFSHVGPYDFAGRYLDTVEAMAAAQETELAGLPQTAGGSTTAEPIEIVAQPLKPGEQLSPEGLLIVEPARAGNGAAAPGPALQAAE